MTANASATGTSPSPSVEVVWPIQSSRKRRSCSAPNSPPIALTLLVECYAAGSAGVDARFTTSVSAILSCSACLRSVNAAMM